MMAAAKGKRGSHLNNDTHGGVNGRMQGFPAPEGTPPIQAPVLNLRSSPSEGFPPALTPYRIQSFIGLLFVVFAGLLTRQNWSFLGTLAVFVCLGASTLAASMFPPSPHFLTFHLITIVGVASVLLTAVVGIAPVVLAVLGPGALCGIALCVQAQFPLQPLSHAPLTAMVAMLLAGALYVISVAMEGKDTGPLFALSICLALLTAYQLRQWQMRNTVRL